MKIIGLGEIVWDCLPSGTVLGGAPLNFTYHCLKAGAEAYGISAVGRDALGEETLRVMSEKGLSREYIQISNLPTSRVLVSLDTAGVPCYEILENVAWDDLEATPQALSLCREADAVCWGALAQREEKSRRAILAMVDACPDCALKVFDINIRQHYYSSGVVEESLKRCNILKLNEDELPLVCSLTGCSDIADIIRRFNLKYVIYTCGADFSEVHSPEGCLSHIKTPQVKVVDTVGAGDSFTATFVADILSGSPVGKAHAEAVSVSAEVCTRKGAM